MAATVSVGSTWSSGVATSASEMRRSQSSAFDGDGSASLGPRGGIIRHADSSLSVAVNGADVITIQPGSAVIPGNAVAGSGAWIASLTSAATITLDPRHVTNPRVDLVVMRQLDVDVVPTHGTRQAQIEVITGTPDPSPTAPTLPTMATLLAFVTVYPSGGAAAAVDLSWRTYSSAVGGFLQVPTLARLPIAAPKWQHATALDTGAEYRWTGSAWQPYRAGPVWVNLPKAGAMTGGTLRYAVHNGYLYVQADGAASIPNSAATTVTATPIPAAYRPDVLVRTGGYFGGEPGTITLGTDGHLSGFQVSGSSRASISGFLMFPVLQ